jgi:hypothetical protein
LPACEPLLPQVHHKKNVENCFGTDIPLFTALPSTWLAIHFGNLVAAQHWVDRLEKLQDRVRSEPNLRAEAAVIMCYPLYLVPFLLRVGHVEKAQAVLAKTGLGWKSTDNEFDERFLGSENLFRPRGDT